MVDIIFLKEKYIYIAVIYRNFAILFKKKHGDISAGNLLIQVKTLDKIMCSFIVNYNYAVHFISFLVFIIVEKFIAYLA